MKNLTSISEHSDWLEACQCTNNRKWQLHRKRVEFGKQPLEKWMFVPCKLVDSVWVALQEPKKEKYYDEYNEFQEEHYDSDVLEYQKSKERCLFEGFEYDQYGFAFLKTKKQCGFDEEYMEGKTIEDLVKYNLEITATAQKQIGL